LRIVTLILCLGLLATTAFAHSLPANTSAAADKTYTHEEGGIQFDAPDGWKSEVDGDVLTLSAPDDSISIVFWVPEADTFDAALEALEEELTKMVKNIKLDGEAKTDTHNGMKHAGLTGSGQIEGADVLWSVDLLLGKKPVIALTFASPGNFEKQAEGYSNLVKSIKKIG
jgi:predicted Zn-dependent protease